MSEGGKKCVVKENGLIRWKFVSTEVTKMLCFGAFHTPAIIYPLWVAASGNLHMLPHPCLQHFNPGEHSLSAKQFSIVIAQSVMIPPSSGHTPSLSKISSLPGPVHILRPQLFLQHFRSNGQSISVTQGSGRCWLQGTTSSDARGHAPGFLNGGETGTWHVRPHLWGQHFSRGAQSLSTLQSCSSSLPQKTICLDISGQTPGL